MEIKNEENNIFMKDYSIFTINSNYFLLKKMINFLY